MSYSDYNPYDLYFETEKRWSGPHHQVGGEKLTGEYGRLVRELVTKTDNREMFRCRLESEKGCFTEDEVIGILPGIFDYIETLPTPSGYVWAAGVLTYFLLVGNKAPQFDSQGEFYRQSGLGSPPPKRTVRDQIFGPQCRWWGLSWEAKQFVKDLTCYDPRERPLPVVAANHPWLFTNLELDMDDDFGTDIISVNGMDDCQRNGSVNTEPPVSHPPEGVRSLRQHTNPVPNGIQEQPPRWWEGGKETSTARIGAQTQKQKAVGRQHATNSDIVVRQHTRKRPKSRSPTYPKRRTPPPKKHTMDIDSFKSIIKIQKEEAAMVREQRKLADNAGNDESSVVWNAFMKKAAKASRKSKRKMKAAEKREENIKKERMERETEEYLQLRDRLHAVEDFGIGEYTEEDMARYSYLTMHGLIDEDKIPCRIV